MEERVSAMGENVGEFVYNKKDLIGHGAFAVVFKGKHRKVRMLNELIELWSACHCHPVFFSIFQLSS